MAWAAAINFLHFTNYCTPSSKGIQAEFSTKDDFVVVIYRDSLREV